MADTTIARMQARFDADIRKFEQALRKATGESERTARLIRQHLGSGAKLTDGLESGVAKSVRAADRSLVRMRAAMAATDLSLAALRRGFALLAAAVSVQQIAQFADQYKTLQNALKISGLEGDSLNSVYRQLYDSAQRNAVPLDELVKLYGRVAGAQKELRASSSDLLKLTDAVALALKVGGQDASTASGALLQLGQALAGGKVQAEEFNSLLDGARPLLQAAASGLKEANGSVGELTRLVKDGKVSSEAFFRAILAGVPVLEQQAKAADPTLSQAWVKLRNRMIDAVGAADKATGATRELLLVMEGMGNVIDKLSGRSYFDGIAGFKDSVRAVEITKQQIELERQLGAARALATQSKLAGDRELVDMLETRLKVLNEEFDRIRQAGWKAVDAPPAPPTPKPFATIPKGKQVSLVNYPVIGGDSGDGDPFTRAVSQVQKSIAVLNAETATIGQNSEARERARTVAILEEAAKRANTEAGRENTAVTAEQRAKIEEVAAAMEKAAQRERMLSEMYRRIDQYAGAGADAFTAWVTGAESAGEAFRKFANNVISDLIRMEAKAAIMAVLAPSGAGGTTGSILGGLFSLFKASGGLVTGPGSSTSDSIPARLSNGEFVVNAAATRKTLPLLEMINSRRFASGGLVGSDSSAMSRITMRDIDRGYDAPVRAASALAQAGGGGGVLFAPTINVAMPSGAQRGDGERFGEEIMRRMQGMIDSRLVKFVTDQKRSGGVLAR